MLRGAGELLLVNVEEEGTGTGRQCMTCIMPSGKSSSSFCGFLITMEEGVGGSLWLVGVEH